MNTAFHDHAFSDSTKIKLEIFQRYVREWLPVFLTRRRVGRNPHVRVNIFDFFSGPGKDPQGNPGSPLIVQEEIKSFCRAQAALKADVSVRMYFNDIDPVHVSKLRATLQESRCSKDCCRYEFSSLPFELALEGQLPSMKPRDAANLVILDQCGVTEVTPDTVKTLVDCGATDIMFFLSTSFLRRFAAEPEMQSKFDIDPKLAKIEENDTIHRYICQYFREKLRGSSIGLAPFSLKKGPNIYGVIFASANLSGLERFLKVCWRLDKHAGEANYNIDNDASWGGQGVLFAESDKPTKTDRFEQDLIAFVGACSPDNRALYRFCLEHGFPSSKANDSLRSLVKKGKVQVLNAQDGAPARKNSYYLTDDTRKVIFKP